MKRVLASTGEIYRRGGDEIVSLAPGLPKLRAQELAEEIRVKLEVEFRKWAAERGLDPSPTASVGLVVDSTGKSPSEINLLADGAQREAKRLGKNRVVLAAS